jgi:inner membrane protein
VVGSDSYRPLATDHRPPTTKRIMLAQTHCLFSLTLTAFALETADWQPLLIAALASQLPDVDTSTSLAGRVLWPLSRWLENRWPHRTVTHSWLATAIIALLAWPLRWQSNPIWSAHLLGYFGGWFGDAFTKSGVAAFYPLSSARLVIPANPRLRLATGSRAEYVVLSVLLLSFVWALHLNTNGGLLRSVNRWLAQPEGVVTLFARASSQHQIFAQIEGRFVASATPVNAEFEVLEVEGERLLVRAANGLLYWAGLETNCPTCHLTIRRVQARLGHRIVIETKEVKWQDEEFGKVTGGWWSVTGKEKVSSDRWSVVGKNTDEPPAISHQRPTTTSPPATSHQPPTTILFSGELTLRDADELRLPTSLQHFNPVEVVGNPDDWARLRTVRVRAATLQDLAPLQASFGSGHLIVKVMRGEQP